MRKEDLKLPHPDLKFHIFGISGLTLNHLLDEALDYCHDDGFSGYIWHRPLNEENTETEEFQTLLVGSSTQGVHMVLTKGEHQTLLIELGNLGSIGDLKLAFGCMKAARKMFPMCDIYFRDESEKEFGLTEDEYGRVLKMLLENYYAGLRMISEDSHPLLQGALHDCFLEPMKGRKEKRPLEIEVEAMNEFIRVQWSYDEYMKSRDGHTEKDGGEEYSFQLADNGVNTFFNYSDHIIATLEGNMKDVEFGEFVKFVEKLPYYNKVDSIQFTLDKMPDEEWKEVFDSLPAAAEHTTRMFILKWNPEISSMKAEDYNKAMAENPSNFHLLWALEDHHMPEKGDLFVMVRNDDKIKGIVFNGVFCTDPYDDEALSMFGLKSRCTLMDCYNGVTDDGQPIITLEELQGAIPEMDWQNVSSGHMLTDDQLLRFHDMWIRKVGSGIPI